MVEFEESELHQDIREGVRRVCRDFPDSYWRDLDQRHEFPWEFYKALAEGGWVGIAIPEEYGGGGLGITEASIVLEEVAASGAAMNGCSAIHLSIFGMNPVVRFGSRRDAAEVPARASPPATSTSRSGSPSPTPAPTPRASRTRAVRDGDTLRRAGPQGLDDEGLVLPEDAPARAHHAARGGAEAHRRPDAPPRRPPGTRRSTITPIPKVGRNAVVSCEVTFDDLVVPVDDRVGEEGKGFKYLLARPQPRADPRGVGGDRHRAGRHPARRRVRELAASSTARRSARTRASPFPLAEAYARLHAAELVVREAAWRYDKGLPCGEQANMAKWLAADAAFTAADQAMQTHGGFGYADRVRRRALLAGGAPHADRADPPGDDPQLPRRARARPAPLLRAPRVAAARAGLTLLRGRRIVDAYDGFERAGRRRSRGRRLRRRGRAVPGRGGVDRRHDRERLPLACARGGPRYWRSPRSRAR